MGLFSFLFGGKKDKAKERKHGLHGNGGRALQGSAGKQGGNFAEAFGRAEKPEQPDQRGEMSAMLQILE